jgi:hypothetical protein
LEQNVLYPKLVAQTGGFIVGIVVEFFEIDWDFQAERSKLSSRRDEPHRPEAIRQEQSVVERIDPSVPACARDGERLYSDVVKVGLDDSPPDGCTDEPPYLVTLAEDDGSSEEGGDQRRNPHADEEEPEAKTPPKAYSGDHLAVLINVYSITADIDPPLRSTTLKQGC